MARRRTRGWAIYSKDDAYKPGLLLPSAKLRNLDPVDLSWKRPLKTLAQAGERARIANQRVEQFVKISRERGATWEQIASVLGVSRQAAWSRYHEHSGVSERQYGKRQLVDTLNTLRDHAVRAQKISIRSAELVQEARRAGQSWEKIAADLGVRRQTAWERYGTPRITTADIEGAGLEQQRNGQW
jgi:hypothetical protein